MLFHQNLVKKVRKKSKSALSKKEGSPTKKSCK